MRLSTAPFHVQFDPVSSMSPCAPIAMGTTLTARTDVLNELRNQTIRVHGLRSIFSAWPFAVNQEVDEVRKDVVRRLDE